MRRSTVRFLFALIVFGILVVACTPTRTPEQTVEVYLDAVTAKKPIAEVIGYVCADYETDARTEADSYGAVTAKLSDLECKTEMLETDRAVVTCTGSISVNYNGETRAIDLTDFRYTLHSVDQQWKICGVE